MLAPTPPGDHYVKVESLKDKQELYPLYLIQCANCGNVELPEKFYPILYMRDLELNKTGLILLDLPGSYKAFQ